MSQRQRIWERSVFWPAALGALLLLASFPLPTSWFGWLGPAAPNVDTSPALEDGTPSWPVPGPWYVSLAHLAWIAPVPWLLLIRRKELPGRRPYGALWLVGFLYWLVQLHWLTLPYWATSLGWLALSWYLAFYLPVFVGLGRVAVHRLGVPILLAAPVIWTGLELARGHLITGFTMCSLGHTQYRWLALIQVSDLVGAYGVGFVVMFVSSCLARMIPLPEGLSSSGSGEVSGSGSKRVSDSEKGEASGSGKRALPNDSPASGARSASEESSSWGRTFLPPSWVGFGWCVWPILPAVGLLAAVLVYGYGRLAQGPEHPGQTRSSEKAPSTRSSEKTTGTRSSEKSGLLTSEASSGGSATPSEVPLRIALIQGSIDTQIKDDPQKQTTIMEQYIRLSQKAVRELGPVDLLVWPETMFRIPLVTFEEPIAAPEEWTGDPEEFRRFVRESADWGRRQAAELARSLGVSVLLGIDGHHFGPKEVQYFNSAVFVDPEGNLLGRYDKMHPVLFGEYVPLAKRIRFLQKLTPLGPGLTEGRTPVAVAVGRAGLRVSPTICYESVLPHVVRRPILRLRAEGKEPDVMANLTNDGWFYGSIELDLHLICGVFRAVECRKPWVIAANTGFSAWIDGDGRIRRLGPRRATGVVLAEVVADPRRSLYLDYGDWFSGLCLAATVLVGLGGILQNRLSRHQQLLERSTGRRKSGARSDSKK